MAAHDAMVGCRSYNFKGIDTTEARQSIIRGGETRCKMEASTKEQLTNAYQKLVAARLDGHGPTICHWLTEVDKLLDQYSQGLKEPIA